MVRGLTGFVVGACLTLAAVSVVAMIDIYRFHDKEREEYFHE